MADEINERLEGMVPELSDLEQKGIFNRVEIKKIVEKRRTFEYRLISNPSVHDYLKYIEYESALDVLRRQRKHELGWKKRNMSDNAGVQRIIVIFERAVAGQYKGDLKLWFQYIDFCLESGSVKQVERVLLKALRIHPKEEKLWIISADRHLRQFHFKAARTMLLRALRFLPNRIHLWQQYLKLECLLGYFAQSHAPQELQTDAPESDRAFSQKDATAQELQTDAPESDRAFSQKDATAQESQTDGLGQESQANAPESDRAISSTAPVAEKVKHASATLDVLSVVVRQACSQLDEDNTSAFLAFAHKSAADYLKVVSTQHCESWRRFSLDIAGIVDGLLDSQRLSIWSLWWTHVGPREVKAQLEIVLSRGSDEILVSWMRACENLELVVEQLTSCERVRNIPDALVSLPLDTKAAQDCLRAVAATNFALQVRLWSIDVPSAEDMLTSCRTANIDASSAWAILRGLPSESRLAGFLDIAFRIDPKDCRSMTIQLLAFQLALGIEQYRECISRLTTDLPRRPQSLNHGGHLLAIFDAILETEARLGTSGLERLFDQTCEMEKNKKNLVDLWVRYELYVEGQGGDGAKIRWRASRVVPAQALVEHKLKMSDR